MADRNLPRRLKTVLTAVVMASAASPAYGMHIAEGILPLSWAMLWFAAAAPFLALGLRALQRQTEEDLSFKPLVGLMAAVVFVVSCMPVPVPVIGTSSHPCGTGLAAILVGPLVTVVIAAAVLLIQALFLAHGGLSTLGAGIFSMGVVGAFAGWLAFRGVRAVGGGLAAAAFAAGVATDWGVYLTTALQLTAGIRGSEPFLPLFVKIVAALVPTQLPLGILEGGATAAMMVLLRKKRPDLLVRMGLMKEQPNHA